MATVEPELLAAVSQPDVWLTVVDLSTVTFLSSQGLQLLLDAADVAHQHDTVLRVLTGDNRVVRRPLELTRLDTVLSLYRDREAALNEGLPQPRAPLD